MEMFKELILKGLNQMDPGFHLIRMFILKKLVSFISYKSFKHYLGEVFPLKRVYRATTKLGVFLDSVRCPCRELSSAWMCGSPLHLAGMCRAVYQNVFEPMVKPSLLASLLPSTPNVSISFIKVSELCCHSVDCEELFYGGQENCKSFELKIRSSFSNYSGKCNRG